MRKVLGASMHRNNRHLFYVTPSPISGFAALSMGLELQHHRVELNMALEYLLLKFDDLILEVRVKS